MSIIETIPSWVQWAINRSSASVGELPRTVAAVAPAARTISTSPSAPSTVFRSATMWPRQRARITRIPATPSRLMKGVPASMRIRLLRTIVGRTRFTSPTS
ncbi:MAG: hypothetical protein KAX26_03520 [Anaerolineae bacterium]|nr:hypothetical protein [Anaerolineae bacterium]